MSITYVLEVDGAEIFEATSIKEVVRKAREKADELQADVAVFKTEEETGRQELILIANAAPKAVKP